MFIFNCFCFASTIYILIVNSYAIENKHDNTFIFNSIRVAQNLDRTKKINEISNPVPEKNESTNEKKNQQKMN